MPVSPFPKFRAAGWFTVVSRLLSPLILWVGAVHCCAQTVSPPIDSFVRLADDEGLIHSDVRAIVQDHQGFMWFGTRIGGLVRFDGYEFKTYQHDPANSRTIGHHVIWSLLIDRSGTLWIGTEGGLARFDRKTDTFVQFRHDPAQPSSLPNDVVTSLCEDRNGKLWAATRGGLCRLDDPAQGRFTTFLRPPVLPVSSTKDTFRSITEDPTTGLLWLGATDGPAAFDPRTGAFASFVNDPQDPHSLGSNAVNKIIRDPDGVFWALTEHGIDSFRPTFDHIASSTVQRPRLAFRRYEQPNNATRPGLNFVRDGLVDRKNRMWLATRAGLQLFDRPTGKFISYRRRPGDASSISDDITHTVFEDRTGNLWIGTYAGGVSRLRSEAKPFRVDRHDPSNPRSVADDRIAGLAFDASGKLWAATTNGLCRLDPDGWTRFVNDPKDPSSLPTNDLATVATAPNGDVWVGTHYTGATRFDGKRFVSMPASPSNLPAPSGVHPFTGQQVNSFLADAHGGIWIAARSYGLDYLYQGQFHHYHPGEGNSPGHPTFNVLLGVFADNGDLWYATETDGIVRFEPATERFTTFHVPVDPTAGSRNLHTIVRTADGLIWIGAADGLIKFDPRTQAFTRQYSIANGLPNNAVMALVPDRRGHIWVGTANGLADFDPRSEKFRAYDQSDGLPSNVFSQRTGTLGPDGRVYLGTRAGIVSFFPEELHDNPNPPIVAITDLRWLGTDRSSTTRIARGGQWPAGDTLYVAPGQLGFSLKFAALDFAAPEKNHYRYRLEGWDATWTAATAREHTATYTSLPPGHYTFHVQASNADGIWNERGATLPIVIEPRIWETAWFRIAISVALAGAIAGGLQWRLRNIRLRNALLEQQVAQRTAQLQNEIAVRQRAEAALRLSHQELERRVRERTAQLAATNTNLETEIAERRNVEAQLRQSQKMEAIGQLAGGIAHDFNNLLTVILGQSELLSMGDLPNDLRTDAVRDIKGAAERASKLTRQLLVFSRREPMRMSPVDLNGIVGSEIELLRRLIGEDVALETSLGAGALGILADAGMIEQLLLNLALNARDAMPQGGRLTIATTLASLSAPDPARSPNALAGRYAQVSVTDTGAGIPADILPRIFEPFFTTKERGKGTGLGLAISHSIVVQHRGWIDVETELGHGTTFRAWLPLHATVDLDTLAAPRRTTPSGDGATVLVVEDEIAVRAIATRVLTRNGYRVIEAGCGADALDQWARHRHEISVLLTDIIMPGQPNGRDLAQRLQREKPSLRVITMSGYDFGTAERNAGSSLTPNQHLRKPFTSTELLAAIAASPLSEPKPAARSD